MPISVDVGSALSGVGTIIDKMRVDDVERATAKGALLEAENTLTQHILAYESDLAKAQRDIIVAEAQSPSWLAANWRPVLMLTITALLAHKYLLFPYLSKWLSVPELVFPDALFTLLTIGVGGYIAGRSGEKIVQGLRGTTAMNTAIPTSARAERKAAKLKARLDRK